MSSSTEFDYIFKILTLGESEVGKTCILVQYTEGKFMKSHLTTIGIDYKSKIVHRYNKSLKLKIWDTAGQEKFRNITQQYYKNADGILLVFDLESKRTFDKISDWMDQIQHNTTEATIPIILIGNKCDTKQREVTKEEAESEAQRFNVPYFETSALENINITEAFEKLTEIIIEDKGLKDHLVKKEKEENKNIVLTNNNPTSSKSKRGCC